MSISNVFKVNIFYLKCNNIFKIFRRRVFLPKNNVPYLASILRNTYLKMQNPSTKQVDVSVYSYKPYFLNNFMTINPKQYEHFIQKIRLCNHKQQSGISNCHFWTIWGYLVNFLEIFVRPIMAILLCSIVKKQAIFNLYFITMKIYGTSTKMILSLLRIHALKNLDPHYVDFPILLATIVGTIIYGPWKLLWFFLPTTDLSLHWKTQYELTDIV